MYYSQCYSGWSGQDRAGQIDCVVLDLGLIDCLSLAMESYITRKCLLSLVEKPGISIKLACSYKMHIVN